MASSAEKLPPLWYSGEQFADYWTALASRVRQHDECDQLFTPTCNVFNTFTFVKNLKDLSNMIAFPYSR